MADRTTASQRFFFVPIQHFDKESGRICYYYPSRREVERILRTLACGDAMKRFNLNIVNGKDVTLVSTPAVYLGSVPRNGVIYLAESSDVMEIPIISDEHYGVSLAREKVKFLKDNVVAIGNARALDYAILIGMDIGSGGKEIDTMRRIRHGIAATTEEGCVYEITFDDGIVTVTDGDSGAKTEITIPDKNPGVHYNTSVGTRSACNGMLDEWWPFTAGSDGAMG